MKLRGRLYPAGASSGRNVTVWTRGLALRPQVTRYAYVELVMDFSALQSHVHDIFVRFSHRQKTTIFRVFFKRHISLPFNTHLGIYGDVVVMRASQSNEDSVVNLRTSDRRISDRILRW